MKILTNYEDLVGKTIAFAHVGHFAKQMTFGTKDGCILMASMTYNPHANDSQVFVYREHRVMDTLQRDTWLCEQLRKRGIFDLAVYKEDRHVRKKQEKAAQKEKKRRR